MLYDTDVLIWVLRGNAKASRAVKEEPNRAISIVTYMDLLQGARDRRETKAVQGFLSDLRFQTLPLTENIGNRAAVYMEEYALSGALEIPDALIAATAVENHVRLLTGNEKHYRPIKDLDLSVFRA